MDIVKGQRWVPTKGARTQDRTITGVYEWQGAPWVGYIRHGKTERDDCKHSCRIGGFRAWIRRHNALVQP